MIDPQPHYIQEFRFRFKPEALAAEEIAYLRFPYESAINEFIVYIAKGRGKDLDPDEYPPFESLNDSLVALSTTLVHGFEVYKIDGQNIRYVMLPSDASRPLSSQLKTVIQPWLRNWVNYVFADELRLRDVLQAYQALMAKLDTPEYDWQIASVNSLWPTSPFIYQAIPSVLAKYLVKQKLSLFGNFSEWRLAKSPGKGSLALVSQPIVSEAANDSFAYVIEFKVQTVPDDPEPFVDLHVHCRRYMRRSVEWLNRNRQSTIMVGLKAPLLAGWPYDTTLVPIHVEQRDRKFFWDDATRHLLEEVNARNLLDPNDDLAPSPARNWFTETEDQYFWLYAQGMEPEHELGSGFSPAELYEVFQQVASLTRHILTPLAPLARDMQSYGVTRPAAMLTTWELMAKGARQIRVFNQKQKTRRLDDDAKLQLKLEATQRALGGELPYLLILYRTDNGRSELRQHAETCLPTAAPDTFIIEKRLEDSATAPFSKDAKIMEAERTRRRIELNGFIKDLKLPQDKIFLALVEVPRDNLKDKDEKVKGVIRQVCVHHKISSQLFVQPKAEIKKADSGRARNSVTDLLIRQTGTIYGDIRDVYQWSGLSAEMAENLTVIGLYRRRTTGRKAIDFPVAVRLLPTSQVEMCWFGQDWLTYHPATLALGEFFWLNRNERHRKEKLKLSKEQILTFVEQICLGINGPTLVLVEAHDFRGVWPMLQNPNLRLNELTFRDGTVFTPAQVKDLRMIRLRTSENDETPQYVRISPTGEDQQYQAERNAEGLYLAGTSGNFQIFHSIGKMPKMTDRGQRVNDPKTGAGGTKSYKHQRISEVISFFVQSGDEVQVLANLVDNLRYTPAWKEGEPTLPLVNHLAVAAVEDVLCLL
ncbi:MAG: hypothetical protein BroJett011_41700 [Chloroflexota bacterium]|nr:MAG: hypothetical protein BroJett011_41700 [Chloroflexota bacterium]